jgi:hypothetical protein
MGKMYELADVAVKEEEEEEEEEEEAEEDEEVAYVVAERFTARLTCLNCRPVTNVCAGCGFDPSSRH